MAAVQQRPLEQKYKTYVTNHTYQEWLHVAVAMSVEVLHIVVAASVEAPVVVFDALVVQSYNALC